MSGAFKTIYIDQVIKILEQTLSKNQMRILMVPLAQTAFQVKIEKAQGTLFESNLITAR